MRRGPQLLTYPDSLGGTLEDIARIFLRKADDPFSTFTMENEGHWPWQRASDARAEQVDDPVDG